MDGRFCETCLVWVFWGQGEWQPNWAWRFLTAISAGVWFKKVAQGERAAFRVFEAICEWKLQSRLSTEGQMSLFQQCLKGEKWKKLRQKQASRNTFFSVVLFDGDGPRVFGVQFLCVVQHSTENSHQEQRYFKNKNPLCFNCVHWFKKIFFFLNKVIKVTYELTCKRVYCTWLQWVQSAQRHFMLWELYWKINESMWNCTWRCHELFFKPEVLHFLCLMDECIKSGLSFSDGRV